MRLYSGGQSGSSAIGAESNHGFVDECMPLAVMSSTVSSKLLVAIAVVSQLQPTVRVRVKTSEEGNAE
jgi:hypothetical protein